jgi:hypothetical protein
MMAAPIEIADAAVRSRPSSWRPARRAGHAAGAAAARADPLPDTLIPLAVGQERSVALVDDVLRGNRMLVMVASRHPEEGVPTPTTSSRWAWSARSRA